jgi:CHAT domain-containing protein/tetratricopeptide (TPR) repeat protein
MNTNKTAWKAAFIYFIFILLLAGRVLAGDASPAGAQETQNKAEELSRHWSGESYRRSGELFLKAADDWSILKETAKSTNCLREAARLKYLMLDYQSAKALLKKSIDLDKTNRDPVSESKSRSLMSLILLQEGEIEQSEAFYKKAVELASAAQDPTALAYSIFSQASYSYFQNDADQTVKLFEESRSHIEKTDNSRLTAEILVELGYAYMKQGNGDAGLKAARESLKYWQKAGDKRGEALTLTAVGLACRMLGDEQTALDTYYSAQEMFPADMDLIDQARTLAGIASVYDKYRDDYLFEKNMRKAYLLFRKAEYPQGQLALLPTLIKINFNAGQRKLAEEYYEEAKQLSKKLKNEFSLGFANETMGNERLRHDQTDEAIGFYDSSLRIFQRLKNKQFIALVNQRLGEAFLKKGNFEEAKNRLTFALAYNREIKDGFAASQNLFDLARLNATLENYGEALENIEESIELTETLYSSVNNSKLQRIYFSNAYDRYELYINFLVKLHARFPAQGYDRRALQTAEKARARVMLETLTLSESNFTKDADAATVAREKEIRVMLNNKADKLTDLLNRNTDQIETERISGEIRDLENELEDIKARFKQQSPIYSAIKNPPPFDIADFQQNVLDENSLLLEFSLGKEESYLWVIGQNEISLFHLPPREQIENSIENLRNLLKEHHQNPDESVEDYQKRIAQADEKYQAEAKGLSKALFGQITDRLRKKRLIVVPDGELHYLPVAALPRPDSDEPFLLTNETIYEPSAQTLAFLTKSQKQPSPTTKNLLIFSDPIFTGDDARLAPENKPFETDSGEIARAERFRFVESLKNLPRLAASKDEGETIMNIVGASKVDNFSGFSATRENLLNLKTDDYKIIHFATHGLTNEERPELSGIVLSRFDEKGQKLNQFFRIQDIYGMNLNADLVVLSACETGIGKEVKGEGLMSLNNAFLQTGAKSVMASLWKVEDGATLALMKNFYTEMADENLTPSEALRRAQIKLRENPSYRSPFYWAAFTMHGDFRNVPQISSRSAGWIYFLPLISIALIGFYLYRRKNYSTARL